MIITKDKTFEEFCDRCVTSCTERTIEKCKREVTFIADSDRKVLVVGTDNTFGLSQEISNIDMCKLQEALGETRNIDPTLLFLNLCPEVPEVTIEKKLSYIAEQKQLPKIFKKRGKR